jgi:NAD-dependent SIR2 family protein deacetylase
MKTAVFLGAGASKAFGFPLTSELLPRMLELLEDPSPDPLFEHAGVDLPGFRRRIEAFIPGLGPTWRRLRESSPGKLPWLQLGVTDVLTLLDHAVATGGVRAGMENDELQVFRRWLEVAICIVLQRAEKERDPSKHEVNRGHFIDWLFRLRDDGELALMTTNYDLVVERPLFEKVASVDGPIERKVDFGFSWRDPASSELVPRPADAKVRLLKLHGSLNALRCVLCGETYVNVLGDISQNGLKHGVDRWNTCICCDYARLRVNLVTPSLVRQVHDASLLGVWQAATEALRVADQWFLIGYSLPSEDVAIRSLLARAWEGRTEKPKVVVIQKGDDVRQLHELMFPGCEYFRDGLAAYPPLKS